jgi:hypothetical protein
MKTPVITKLLFILATALLLSACGANKKDIAMKLHSDPLGAYALLQVKHKGNENADWIFLGPTPVITSKEIILEDATTISLKVVRPGFYEQVKTWKAKDFLREYKENKEIVWVPNMVQQ